MLNAQVGLICICNDNQYFTFLNFLWICMRRYCLKTNTQIRHSISLTGKQYKKT